MEALAFTMGRCAQQIYKIEQLHSMKHVTRTLMETNDTIEETIQGSVHGLKDLESQFKVFDDQAQERTTN